MSLRSYELVGQNGSQTLSVSSHRAYSAAIWLYQEGCGPGDYAHLHSLSTGAFSSARVSSHLCSRTVHTHESECFLECLTCTSCRQSDPR